MAETVAKAILESRGNTPRLYRNTLVDVFRATPFHLPTRLEWEYLANPMQHFGGRSYWTGETDRIPNRGPMDSGSPEMIDSQPRDGIVTSLQFGGRRVSLADRLQSMGCSGSHAGGGLGCPREPHHHHELRCPEVPGGWNPFGLVATYTQVHEMVSDGPRGFYASPLGSCSRSGPGRNAILRCSFRLGLRPTMDFDPWDDLGLESVKCFGARLVMVIPP